MPLQPPSDLQQWEDTAIRDASQDTNDIWIALPPDPKQKQTSGVTRLGLLAGWRQKPQPRPAPRESDATVDALRCSGQI